MPSLLPRTAVALVAVLAVAWSAVLLRDERLARGAEDRITGNPEMSDGEFARTMEAFEAAELLNPGTQWTLVRANVLLLRDKPEALRVADSILADEPDNLGAWVVVHKATQGRDPRRAAEALAQIRRLNPPPGGGDR
jgi:hypothetical protein